MGQINAKDYKPTEQCDIACQKDKKIKKLNDNIRICEQLSKVFLYESKNIQKKRNILVHGQDWVRHKNLTEQNSKLKTKYDSLLNEYQIEFNTLMKHYIDSIYLMTTQTHLININKSYDTEKGSELDTQMDTLKTLSTSLSTNKRNVVLSKTKRERINKQLIIQKYLFYTIICFIVVGTLYILVSEIASRIVINNSETKFMNDSLKTLQSSQKPAQ